MIVAIIPQKLFLNRHLKKLKVAAYCRVSTKQDHQSNSLKAQMGYYENYIKNHANWIFVDIYAEHASGLRLKDRLELQRLLKDCMKGKINLIITKSMNRFGRNTVDTLKIIRDLGALNINIYFETEGLNSMNRGTRTPVEILAAVAQEESRIKSENTKWGIRQSMKRGNVKLNYTNFFGYTKDNCGNLVIVEEEAIIVRLIFELLLKGYGCRKIKRHLEENNIKTVSRKDSWSTSTIDRILRNEKYIGNILMQKSFTANFLSSKQVKNNGELEQYFIENNHEPIIEKEVFDKVQEKLRKIILE